MRNWISEIWPLVRKCNNRWEEDLQLPPHKVHQPRSVEELFTIQDEAGEDAALYAGGTELLLAIKLGAFRFDHLIDVKRIPELHGVWVEDGVLCIGAATTHRQIETDSCIAQDLPALGEVARRVANIRVRSVGTIGGNLAFGEPHADPPTLLEALRARVVLAGKDSRRQLSMGEFAIGAYETALNQGELLMRIEIPLMPNKLTFYEKFQILERPTIGVAASATIKEGIFEGDPIIVVGSIGESPTRIPAEDLAGRSIFDDDATTGVAENAAVIVDPVEDLSGREDYKRHLTATFVRRVLQRFAQSWTSS